MLHKFPLNILAELSFWIDFNLIRFFTFFKKIKQISHYFSCDVGNIKTLIYCLSYNLKTDVLLKKLLLKCPNLTELHVENSNSFSMTQFKKLKILSFINTKILFPINTILNEISCIGEIPSTLKFLRKLKHLNCNVV